MARCRSWRPLAGSGHDEETGPGGSERLWVPCRNHVPTGVQRCVDCENAIMSHPDPVVRRMLAEEENQDRGILEVLAGDLNQEVAQAATDALASQGE